MTREETKKCIEVMQAYVDGKEIEYSHEDVILGRNIWNTSIAEGPLWNWEEFQYRIKEELQSAGGKRTVTMTCEEWTAYLEYKFKKKEEPTPFGWRGKNIQWVKTCNLVSKVISVQHNGVICINPCGKLGEEALVKWDFLKEFSWQWSEDNATWRDFV